MTRDEWIEHGVEEGWMTTVCFMHDAHPPLTDEETAAFEEYDDPCIHRYVVLA